MLNMQLAQPFFKTAPHRIGNQLHKLLDDEFTNDNAPMLLNQQPVSQRQIFLTRAITEKAMVFAQLLPINHDGQRVNIHGQVSALNNDRYLFQANNVSYVVTFDQINYLAKL